jgi:hypothetical protein
MNFPIRIKKIIRVFSLFMYEIGVILYSFQYLMLNGRFREVFSVSHSFIPCLFFFLSNISLGPLAFSVLILLRGNHKILGRL